MTKKVALVTGASRGIGAACAVALSRAGYRVVVHYRGGEEKARALVNSLTDAVAMRADLTQPDACEQLIKVIKTEMGSLDVLVNNAGVSMDQLLPFAKPEDFDLCFATNLKPVFLLSKFAAKVMIKQRAGKIINLSSVVGYTGNGGQSIYSSSKAAITAFTKSIAIDLAPFGITANCVAPGLIDTEMTAKIPAQVKEQITAKIPLKRSGTPEEVAAAVEFLASDKASYMTGSTIHVNGGMFPN